jgi:hypothetical protein
MKRFCIPFLLFVFAAYGLKAADTAPVIASRASLSIIENKGSEKPIQVEKINQSKNDLKKSDIKNLKKLFKTAVSSMVLVGGALMVFGLLLYLVVTNALWLGIAVMVLGFIILLYGVLQQFF